MPEGEVVRGEPPGPVLTVGFAPVKGDRPEWAVQKLTELGVDRIMILLRSAAWFAGKASEAHNTWTGCGPWPGRRPCRAGSCGCRRSIGDAAGDDLAAQPGVAMASPGGVPPTPGLADGAGRSGGRLDAPRRTRRPGPRSASGRASCAPNRRLWSRASLLAALRAGWCDPDAGDEPTPARPDLRHPFGVYVHVPFCTRRCDYCAFATWTDRHHLTDAYVTPAGARSTGRSPPGWLRRPRRCSSAAARRRCCRRAQLARILGAVPRQPGAEVTVECNPETVDAAKLRGYRDAGVTRLSFGVQSMVPHVLAALGRQHDVPSVRRAVDGGRGGRIRRVLQRRPDLRRRRRDHGRLGGDA